MPKETNSYKQKNRPVTGGSFFGLRNYIFGAFQSVLPAMAFFHWFQ